MHKYLVKCGKNSADTVTVRKGTKNAPKLIDKWKNRGYKEVLARSPTEAIEKVCGVRIIRR